MVTVGGRGQWPQGPGPASFMEAPPEGRRAGGTRLQERPCETCSRIPQGSQDGLAQSWVTVGSLDSGRGGSSVPTLCCQCQRPGGRA